MTDQPADADPPLSMKTQCVESIFRMLTQASNTLLDCPEKFDGEYDEEVVERFIAYIVSYKAAKNISDDQCLRELPHLLRDRAYAWWTRKNPEMTTWELCLQLLYVEFSQVRPAFAIYEELFGKLYDGTQTLEDFIFDKVDLLAQLPKPQPTKEMQLDMIYALLPPGVKAVIERNDFVSLKTFVNKIKVLQPCVNEENEKSRGVTPTNEENTDLNLSTQEVPVPNINFGEEDDNASMVNAADNGEPAIKVRRTEDLMAQLAEPSETNVTIISDSEEEEFITEAVPDEEVGHTASSTICVTSNNEVDFHIDKDLMRQINNIIDNCDAAAISPPVTENTVTDANNCNSDPHVILPPATLSTCLPPTHMPSIARTTSVTNQTHKTTLKTVISASKKRKRAGSKLTIPQKQFAHRSENQAAHGDAANMPPPLAPLKTDNHKASTSKHGTAASAAAESHRVMTTKLISPDDVPSPTKSALAKLRNSNSSTLKCHQCGTKGYYRSICPKCSPIYFYKPPVFGNR